MTGLQTSTQQTFQPFQSHAERETDQQRGEVIIKPLKTHFRIYSTYAQVTGMFRGGLRGWIFMFTFSNNRTFFLYDSRTTLLT